MQRSMPCWTRGATSLFVSKEAAKGLRLRMEPTEKKIEAIISEAVGGIGIARDVETSIDDWMRKFTLGMEFFDKVDALIGMRTESLISIDPKCQVGVPTIRPLTTTKNTTAVRLMEGRQRIEKPVAKLRVRPQPSEGPKVER